MVTVYGTTTCMPCRSTKKHLEKKGVAFDFVDVSTNEAAHAKITSLGYQSVPVIVTTDGRHWQGFQPDRLDSLA